MAQESQTIDNSKTTILVAEDEPAVRELLKRILKKEGYSILVATGGKEALHIAGEEGPAGGVGLEVAGVLREHRRRIVRRVDRERDELEAGSRGGRVFAQVSRSVTHSGRRSERRGGSCHARSPEHRGTPNEARATWWAVGRLWTAW